MELNNTGNGTGTCTYTYLPSNSTRWSRHNECDTTTCRRASASIACYNNTSTGAGKSYSRGPDHDCCSNHK